MSIIVLLLSPDIVYANGLSIELRPSFNRNTEPEGPNPNNPNHYTTFTFNLVIKGNKPNAYYNITATLDSTKYRGSSANYGGWLLDEDLKFHRDDYIRNGTKLLVWDYGGIKNLSKSLTTNAASNDIPTSIVIRCYDYGPKGKVTVKIKETGLFGPSATDSHSVPYDENDNGILDGWNNDDMRTHKGFLGKTKPGFDKKADDESFTGNSNNGDGWSVVNEFRGLWGKTKHIRLDPSKKDVIFGTGASLSSHGTGYYNIPYHEIRHVDLTYVLHPFANVSNDNMTAPKPNKDINKDIGWVNFNSEQLPGFKRVWAIRVTSRGKHPLQKSLKWGDTLGLAARGSPNKRSLIIIFTGEIREHMTNVFEIRKNDKTKNFTYQPYQLEGAIHTLTSAVISHEIGHTLNLDDITNPKCVMNGSANFTPDPSLPPGLQIKLTATGFTSVHLQDWAATGHEGDNIFRIDHVDPASVVWYGETEPPQSGTSSSANSPTNNPSDSSGGNSNPSDSSGGNGNPSDTSNGGGSNNPSNPSDTSNGGGSNNPSNPSGTSKETPAPPANSRVTRAPGPPTGLWTSYGNGSVTINWTAPTDSGTSSVNDYQYRYRDSTVTTWGDWTNCESTSTVKSVDGLTNGTTYNFQVRTITNDGYSIASSLVSGTPSTTPGAPYNITTTSYTTSVRLNWTAPSNGGSAITDYQIAHAGRNNSFGDWASAGDTNSGETVSGLLPGNSYKFKVRAVNINGVGTESSIVYASTNGRPPDAPTSFTATAGDGQVDLSWSYPYSDNGSTITRYEYSYRQGTSGSFSSWTSVGYSFSKTVSSLTNGTEYQFRVRAVNAYGGGTRAGPVSATPVSSNTAPGAPGTLYALGGVNGNVVLTWTLPSDNGGSAITGYEYTYKKSSSSTWNSWSSTGYGTGRVQIVSGLTDGTNYDFKVRAVNAIGSGSESSTATAASRRVIRTPDAPRNLSASNHSTGKVTLSWDAPIFNGGASITGYEYRVDKGNDGSWSSWGSTGSWGTRTTVRLRNLSTNTRYGFQVRAVNSQGSGSASLKTTIRTSR